MIPQKYSIGFESGDAGGQFIIRDPKMPVLVRYDIEFLTACEGALSCMKISDFCSFGGRLWYHGSKFAVRKVGRNWNPFNPFRDHKWFCYFVIHNTGPKYYSTTTLLAT